MTSVPEMAFVAEEPSREAPVREEMSQTFRFAAARRPRPRRAWVWVWVKQADWFAAAPRSRTRPRESPEERLSRSLPCPAGGLDNRHRSIAFACRKLEDFVTISAGPTVVTSVARDVFPEEVPRRR